MSEEKQGHKASAAELTKKALKSAGVKMDKGPSIAGIEKKEDFTELANVQIAEGTTLARNGELGKAIDMLFALEKKCRLGNDISNLKRVVTTMCDLCHEVKDWQKLNSTLLVVNKRHQQSRHAILAVVDQTMGWLDETPSEGEKVALLDTLREVTDGKIFVEAQRAKLTRQLAMIREKNGDVVGACDCMLEVYVETYGALSKREKIDFILEQIRLTIAKQDWVRVLIVAKKIQQKILNEPDHQDLKLRYHRLMVQYYLRQKDAFELANCFHSLYTTPLIHDEEGDGDNGWRFHLQATVLFLCLSKHTNHQSDMIHRVASADRLDDLPEWKATITLFTTQEIIGFPLTTQQPLEQLLRSIVGDSDFAAWQLMTHTRVTEHNLRVVAKYYKRITSKRLAHLLGLTEDETEKHLASQVSEGSIFAKIDRPAGIVVFKPKVSAEETLSDWSSDIGQLLSLVERTCHLINKEHMIHKLA